MRIQLASAVALLVVLAVCGPAASTSQAADEVGRSGLVVHEWGTFTSFSGSNGIRLEFRPLADNDLPEFVLDRAEQAGYLPTFSKFRIAATQRMETPVTYFYTKQPRDVRVSVGFPEGLLTEFYPPVAGMLPLYNPKQDNMTLEGGKLDWGTVRLIPQQLISDADRRLVPNVEGDYHYGLARETDSAYVRVERAAGLTSLFAGPAPPNVHVEKFLFYRGVGNFVTPLRVIARGGGRFEVTNHGPEGVRALFLVHVEQGQVDFAFHDQIAAGSTQLLTRPRTTSDVDRLCDAVVRALVGEGLFEKEARAMVETWRSSWFSEPGTRLFYVVPGRAVDELLPLAIEPQPDKVVRVLVGRMELLTPERETQLAAELKQMAKEAIGGEPASGQALLRLGRFAEPALMRLSQISQDQDVLSRVASLLTRLQPQE